MLAYTPVDQIPQIHDRLKKSFGSGKLRNLEDRKQQLAQLAYLVEDNVKRFEEALFADLGKTPFEAAFTETEYCVGTIINTIKGLDKWAAPKKAPFDIGFYAMSPIVKPEPKGTVLLITPFNYPGWLVSYRQFAAAIAAGNMIVVKPSESIEATAALFVELIPKYLDPDVVAVVTGGVPETTALLDLKWDHIMFTGSGKVGKIISAAAARHLTPVTLELGGKSPVVIDRNVDLDLAARRILWGKACNAGQSCLAPDYALVHREVEEPSLKALVETYKQFYPKSASSSGPSAFQDLGRIVNQAHFKRVETLLDTTKGTIVIGGSANAEERFVAPTILKNIKLDDSLMQDELFAPILPVIAYDTTEEAVGIINGLPHPLAVYVFSNDTAIQRQVIDNTKSGATMINEVIMYVGCDKVPFGGVGDSGHGSHGGYYGFKAFSHERVHMRSPGWLDYSWILGFRFPPYTDASVAGARRMLRTNGSIPYPRVGESKGWFGGWLKVPFM